MRLLLLLIFISIFLLFSSIPINPDYFSYQYIYSHSVSSIFPLRTGSDPLFDVLLILSRSFHVQYPLFRLLTTVSAVLCLCAYFFFDTSRIYALSSGSWWRSARSPFYRSRNNLYTLVIFFAYLVVFFISFLVHLRSSFALLSLLPAFAHLLGPRSHGRIVNYYCVIGCLLLSLLFHKGVALVGLLAIGFLCFQSSLNHSEKHSNKAIIKFALVLLPFVIWGIFFFLNFKHRHSQLSSPLGHQYLLCLLLGLIPLLHPHSNHGRNILPSIDNALLLYIIYFQLAYYMVCAIAYFCYYASANTASSGSVIDLFFHSTLLSGELYARISLITGFFLFYCLFGLARPLSPILFYHSFYPYILYLLSLLRSSIS